MQLVVCVLTVVVVLLSPLLVLAFGSQVQAWFSPAISTLAASGHLTSLSAYQVGDEIIEQRTGWSKTYWEGGTNFRLATYPRLIHYKDNPSDPLEFYKEIDCNIVPSPNPNWDWEVMKGIWHLLVKNDTAVALGRYDNWLQFMAQGMAYIDWQTKDYIILQTPSQVSPSVSGNTIRWVNLFQGCNLEYIYTEQRFEQRLEITQGARDWFVANPPHSYGLNDTTTYLVLYSSCDWSLAYSATVDGHEADWSQAIETTASTVDFWGSGANCEVASLTPSLVFLKADQNLDSALIASKRFFPTGGGKWLLCGVEASTLNNFPDGTVILDTDAFFPIGDDAGGATYNALPYIEYSKVMAG